MRTRLLISTAFLPPIWYVAAYDQALSVSIETFEHYQKRTYRNRAFIQSDKGPHMVSVPLKSGKNSQCPIQSVELATDKSWQHTMYQKVQSCYRHAPFFDHYEQLVRDIIQLYLDEHYLFRANERALLLLLNTFSVSVKHDYTTAYMMDTSAETFDARHTALTYLKEHQAYYPQVFEDRTGFQSGLSCLDILLEKGPESLKYLHQLNVMPTHA